jgi:DNA-damage-inducible protein D
MLKRKLGVPDARPVADFLPTINIKAKDLAAEMTSVNVQTKDLYGIKPIETEHVDNNLAERCYRNEALSPNSYLPQKTLKKWNVN